jgi:DNA invertase Pin-like site-specific DNA recombinase
MKTGLRSSAFGLSINGDLLYATMVNPSGDSAMAKGRRVGIYTRVSTGDQTTLNQERELRTWAERAGHSVVQVFEDQGISGTKGRDRRPAFDELLKAATRREIDMIAVWASDRLGRSLEHLIEVLTTIKDSGVALFIYTQAVDTTTPAGRALFQMLGVFAELERSLIVDRSNAGLARVKETLAKDGEYTTKKGKVIKRLGRPGANPKKIEEARKLLKAGIGILKVAGATGLGTGTVHRLKREASASA